MPQQNSPGRLKEDAVSTETLKEGVSAPPEKGDVEIDLVEIWLAIAAKKWFILGVTALVTIAAAVSTHFLTPKYSSKVIMSSNELLLEEQFPIHEIGMDERAVIILKSTEFIVKFIRKFDMKRFIFYKRWDDKNKRWKPNDGLKDKVKNKIMSMLGKSVKKDKNYEPSDESAARFFIGNIMKVAVKAATKKSPGRIIVKITWVNASQAKEWANRLAECINIYMKETIISERKKVINNLKHQLRNVSLLKHKRSIYNMIEDNNMTITMARVQPSDSFIFKIVTPARKPTTAFYKPSKRLIIQIALILSLVVTTLIVLVLDWWKKRKQATLDRLLEEERLLKKDLEQKDGETSLV